METHGRHVIYANYTEEQLLSGTDEERANKVIDILQNSIGIHQCNKTESKYLIDYVNGIQDIKDKEKYTRPEINNKGVENWAHAFREWKTANLLGKPIQYAPLNDIATNEITLLNGYNSYENKETKDQEIYDDIFTVGRGFRYVNGSKMTEEDETPYDLINLDVLNTEVVYSSSIKHEQLLAFIETSKKYIAQEVDPNTGEKNYVEKLYDEYTVYTRNKQYVISNKNGNWQVESTKPILCNEHIVTEYYKDKCRVSDLEIGKDIFNDINNIENNDLDDIVQNVNNIMVFTNAEVNRDSMDGIKEFGAVSIKSTDQKQAKIELLQSRIKSLDTQLFYLRKLQAIHSILNVPIANNSGNISNAETGRAVLTGQGFTSSSVVALKEETAFKRCDRNSLKAILKICRGSSSSGIKELRVKDIEIKSDRSLNENMLTKSTTLLNLMNAKIPPIIRNSVVDLFNNPLEVTKLQEKYEQEIENKQKELNDLKTNNQNIQESNNKIEDNTQLENQQQ